MAWHGHTYLGAGGERRGGREGRGGGNGGGGNNGAKHVGRCLEGLETRQEAS